MNDISTKFDHLFQVISSEPFLRMESLGGEIQCEWWLEKHPQLATEIQELGMELDKVYTMEDLVKSDQTTFTATGIIQGPLLEGVTFGANIIKTRSVSMRNSTKTVRWIEAEHRIV